LLENRRPLCDYFWRQVGSARAQSREERRVSPLSEERGHVKGIIVAGAVAALVATSTATAAFVVTSANIKNGTIQLADISKKAKRGLKGNRGPRGFSGSPGPAGAPGPQGPPGIQQLRFVLGPRVFIAPEGLGRSDATCPPGEIPVSGGFGFAGAGSSKVFQEIRSGSAWVVQASNFGSLVNAELTAYAYCSPGVVASGTETNAEELVREARLSASRAAH
jgi:hypothetical protein